MDFETVDFFRDDSLVPDPYPYFDALRQRCPVVREPNHDVVMVTGYDEAAAVFGDSETFSSCNSVTGPFPGFPGSPTPPPDPRIVERARKYHCL